MNANDAALNVVLFSYNKTGRVCYKFSLKTGSAERIPLEPLQESAAKSNGLGEFVRLHRFKKEEQFVALFALNGEICLAMGRKWFAISDQTTVRLIPRSRSLLSGRKKTFELHQAAKVLFTLTTVRLRFV